jgi:hypothetical protein
MQNKIMSLNLASKVQYPSQISTYTLTPTLALSPSFQFYNSMLEKKSLLNEEVVCKHVHGNTKMPCQSIPQCGHFIVDLKRELCKSGFSPKSGSTPTCHKFHLKKNVIMSWD